MSYGGLTYEAILQRMLDRVTTRVDKREGSVIWDALAPAAVELKLMYIELDRIMDDAFADTAAREFLIRRCAERGITPAAATHAVVRGEFAPADIDLTGQRFRAPNRNIMFTAVNKIGAGVYELRCETAGVAGSHYLGTVIPAGYIDGLETAELTGVLAPGQDEEDTERLRRRYMDSFNKQAFGGNLKDYTDRAKALGAGAVKVTPVWAGGGTVLLTVLDSEYSPASEYLTDRLQEALDPTGDHTGLGLAPIGHAVTVRAAAAETVDVATELTFAEGHGWASTGPAIRAVLEEYMLELRRDWENQDALTMYGPADNPTTVRISHIDSRILGVAGVLDVKGTRLNGRAANMETDTYAVPVLGDVGGV